MLDLVANPMACGWGRAGSLPLLEKARKLRLHTNSPPNSPELPNKKHALKHEHMLLFSQPDLYIVVLPRISAAPEA